MTLMTGMLGKTDFILNAAGAYGGYNLGSLENFVLDEENIAYLRRVNQGLDITEDKLYFDLIKKTGPRGNYLSGRTPREYREDNYLASPVFNRKGCKENTREEEGDICDRAQKIYDARMASYKLPDLSLEQKKLLNSELPNSFKFEI